MKKSYSPATLKLARALSHLLPAWSSTSDEAYRVHEMCLLLSNQAYAELCEQDYKSGNWPAPNASILGALRGALDDHRNSYTGQSIARLLTRYGCREVGTLAALHPWDRLMFTWRSQGHSLETITELFRQAAVDITPSPEGPAIVARRLANPVADMGDHWGIIFSLLDTRAVFCSLCDIGFEPPHHQLFQLLCHSLGVEVAEVSQSCNRQDVLVDTGERLGDIALYTSDGAHWIIGYRHQGTTGRFTAQATGTRMDIASVLHAFDQLMQELGRPERAFQFAYGPDDNQDFGAFLAADAKLFPALAEKLSLPLQELQGAPLA